MMRNKPYGNRCSVCDESILVLVSCADGYWRCGPREWLADPTEANPLWSRLHVRIRAEQLVSIREGQYQRLGATFHDRHGHLFNPPTNVCNGWTYNPNNYYWEKNTTPGGTAPCGRSCSCGAARGNRRLTGTKTCTRSTRKRAGTITVPSCGRRRTLSRTRWGSDAAHR